MYVYIYIYIYIYRERESERDVYMDLLRVDPLREPRRGRGPSVVTNSKVTNNDNINSDNYIRIIINQQSS